MWPRVVEMLLGVWLLLSPFIFGHWQAGDTGLYASDFACAAAVILLALLSFAPRLGHAHLLNIAVAIWLMAWGYLGGGHPAAPGCQNAILLGLILILLAIMPNEASQPPTAWRAYYLAKARKELKPRR